MNEKIKKTLLNVFYMITTYLFLVNINYIFLKIIDVKNSFSIIQTISFSLPIIYLLIKNKNDSIQKNIAIIAIYTIVLIGFPFLATKRYDISQDGNVYHKPAIGFIKEGWNPLYETVEEFQDKIDSPIKINKKINTKYWINHYPKANWVIAANFYQMTGNIESGKAFLTIFMFLTFIICYINLNKFLNIPESLILSVLAVLNPITLSQINTHYVDGIMGMCFLIEILLLIDLENKNFKDRELWISICSIICIFVNIKFTGLLCSGVIAAVYYFYWCWRYRKDLNFIKKLTIKFSVIFFIAIFIIGSTSYVKNTITNKNPLYPLFGKGKIDIVTTMQPKSFAKKNKIEKVISTIFAKTENVTYDSGNVHQKSIFKVTEDEIDALMLPDTRIGAFGPLFTIIMITSILLLSIEFFRYTKDKKYIILPIITLAISMILIGEVWWHRYIPQLYYLPISALAICLYNGKQNKNNALKLIALINLIVIVININYFITANSKLNEMSIKINEDLKQLQTHYSTLKLTNPDTVGYLYNLKDNNIKYVLKENINGKFVYVYSWRIMMEVEQ